MYQNDETIKNMIIAIMDIKNETDYIQDLDEWIYTEGIDEVFKKIIRMYSTMLR